MPNISTIGNNLIKLSEIDFHEQKITQIASLLIKRRSSAICLLIEAQTLWRQILMNFNELPQRKRSKFSAKCRDCIDTNDGPENDKIADFLELLSQ